MPQIILKASRCILVTPSGVPSVVNTPGERDVLPYAERAPCYTPSGANAEQPRDVAAVVQAAVLPPVEDLSTAVENAASGVQRSRLQQNETRRSSPVDTRPRMELRKSDFDRFKMMISSGSPKSRSFVNTGQAIELCLCSPLPCSARMSGQGRRC